MKNRAAKRKEIAEKLTASIARLSADIARRRERMAKAKQSALPGFGKGKLIAGWFSVWEKHAIAQARAEGQLARSLKRAPIANTAAQEAATRARLAEAAKQRRDAQTASINRRFETLHAGPHPQANWSAERAEEEKRLKRLKKQIAKRTSKDFSNRYMLEKPVKLPEPVKQPDPTPDAEPLAPPREGLIPGTYRVFDPSRLGAGLLDADPLPQRWTARHVGARLIEAMEVLRRTPMNIWPKGYGAAWPAYRHEGVELAYQAGAGTLEIGRNAIRRYASSEEVARMTRALDWPIQFLSGCNYWALSNLNNWAAMTKDPDENPPTDLLQFIADALNAANEVVE